jgi:hypothetical protein
MSINWYNTDSFAIVGSHVHVQYHASTLQQHTITGLPWVEQRSLLLHIITENERKNSRDLNNPGVRFSLWIGPHHILPDQKGE